MVYLESNFTIHKIKYKPNPTPANKKATTKPILIYFASTFIFGLNQSETPKIIFLFFVS